MSRMAYRDPTICAILGVVGNRIVAHGICEILEVDRIKILFIGQVTSEVPGALDKMLPIAENWGRSMGATVCRTEAMCNVFTERLSKRYHGAMGFHMISYVLEKSLIDGREEQQPK